MAKKTITRRTNAKYPALDPALNLKTRVELVDYDYIDKLSDKEKEWLNTFTNEYVHAEFKSKRIQKKKRAESEKNQAIKELKVKLAKNFKEISNLVTNANVSVSTKNYLKKLLKKVKTAYKKRLEREKAFIEDIYKKEAYDRNNARNRCVLTRAKAQGKAFDIDLVTEKSYSSKDSIEDALIEALDAKRLSDRNTSEDQE